MVIVWLQITQQPEPVGVLQPLPPTSSRWCPTYYSIDLDASCGKVEGDNIYEHHTLTMAVAQLAQYMHSFC